VPSAHRAAQLRHIVLSPEIFSASSHDLPIISDKLAIITIIAYQLNTNENTTISENEKKNKHQREPKLCHTFETHFNYCFTPASSVAGSIVLFVNGIKVLRHTVDNYLSFDQYVADVVRSCNYHIR